MNHQNNHSNANRLLDAIGHAPDDIVTATAPDEKKHPSRLWRRLAVIAACLVLLGAIAIAAIESGLPDHGILPDGEIDRVEPSINPEHGAPEMDILLPWDQYPINERYGSVDFDGREYSTQGVVAQESLLGEALGEVTAVGYDWSHNNKKKTAKATAYAIQGVSVEFAVALRFETGEIGVYADTTYRPETLGDLIDDLALDTLMTFGDVYTDGNDYVYHNVPDEDIRALMLFDRTLKNVYDEANLATGGYGSSIASASVYIEALGYRNISLSVTDAGYLKTNIGSTGKAFFIGKDKAQQIADYIAEHYEGERYLYRPDGGIAVPEGGVIYPDGVDVPESSGAGQGSAGEAQTMPYEPK